jgi:hypothetical protein
VDIATVQNFEIEKTCFVVVSSAIVYQNMGFSSSLALQPTAYSVRCHFRQRPSAGVQRWTVMPAGDHFAALEEPETLATNIRACFRDRRQA